MLKIIPLIIILAFSCQDENKEYFSKPNWTTEDTQQDHKIYIAVTGSLQEQITFSAQLLKGSKKNIRHGGIEVLAKYFDILKLRYQDKLVKIHSGPLFSSRASLREKNTVLDFFQYVDFDALQFETNLLDSYLESKENLISKKLNIINSSLIDLKTGTNLLPNFTQPYRILKKGQYKVGVIALNKIVSKKYEISSELPGFIFKDPVLSFLQIKELMKKERVNAIIGLVNFDSHCYSTDNHESKTIKAKFFCPKNDPLEEFINRLPSSSIDLIISHGEQFIHGSLHGIPVVQNPGNSNYISVVEIPFDNKLKPVRRNITIQKPIKTCHSFIFTTNDCYIEDAKLREEVITSEVINIIDAKYLGVPIEKVSEITESIKKNRL